MSGELGDVQRRGIAAALALFDRVIEGLEGADGRRPRLDAALGALESEPPAVDLRAAVARTIDLYADLLRQTLELYADALRDGSGADAAVALAGAPGTVAAAPVWMHNATDAPVGAVALRMTDLTAHDGATIGASAASFAPELLEVEPAASAASTISVGIPAAAAGGAYFGHVLAKGLPGARLPVCLVVEP